MLKFNLIPTKKKEDSIIIMKNFFENIYFNNISLFLVLTISLIYICSIFFSYKFNNKDKLSLSTLFLIVFIFSLIFFKIFVLFLIFIPSYIFFYKKDIEYISFRILFLTIYITLLSRISGMIVAITYIIIDHDTSYTFNIHRHIIFLTLILILTSKVNKLLVSLINSFKLFKTYFTITSTILCIMLIIYNLIWIYSFIGNNNIIYYLSIIIIFTFVILFLLISSALLKNIKTKVEVETEKERLIQQKRYIEALEKNNSEIRKFKHDFNNIILGLEGYINTSEINNDELKKYFYDNLVNFNSKLKLDDITLSHLNSIKVKSLKSLLTNKISIAQNNNIDVKLIIENEIKDVFTNEMQLSRVIGILLDNAIEACLELESDKLLEITILRIDKTIDFQIANNFLNTGIPIEELKKEGYSSKGENRGLGLISAQDIIKNYNMILTTKIENNMFKQILTIEGSFYNEDNYL